MELQENDVGVIIVESPAVFATMIDDLLRQCGGQEGGFVFSQNDKMLNMSKEVCFVLEPFTLEMNQKKVLTKVYEDLAKEAYHSDHYESSMDIFAKLQDYIYDLLDAYPELPLTLAKDISVEDMLKVFQVKIEEEASSLAERLIDYLHVMSVVFKKKIAVFVNLTLFLEPAEIRMVYDYVNYHKIQLVLLEAQNKTLMDQREKCLIIDASLSEIY